MRIAASPRIDPEDLARDRSFWSSLLQLRPLRCRALPAHGAAGFRHRRFPIMRDAAWVTLYRSATPSPQIGVFLRCKGLAGDAFFTLVDGERDRIEPILSAGLGPGARMEWGSCHHPGMTDIAGIIDAPLPWTDAADGLHIAWLLQTGDTWYSALAPLARSP
jgi:hypothetical protein